MYKDIVGVLLKEMKDLHKWENMNFMERFKISKVTILTFVFHFQYNL